MEAQPLRDGRDGIGRRLRDRIHPRRRQGVRPSWLQRIHLRRHPSGQGQQDGQGEEITRHS